MLILIPQLANYPSLQIYKVPLLTQALPGLLKPLFTIFDECRYYRMMMMVPRWIGKMIHRRKSRCMHMHVREVKEGHEG